MMKTNKILLFLLLIATGSVNGKGYFTINSTIGPKIILVNGKKYQIDSTFIRIQTLYPAFDSVLFYDVEWNKNQKVICNFNRDSSYSLIYACCGSTDVVPAWKAKVDSLKIWDYEVDFDKIQRLLLDHPHFTLKITNGSLNDSIYGWYADAACFPSFKLIDEQGWNYGVAIKCFYWTNISNFQFFKSKKDYSKYRDTNGIVNDVFPPTPDEEKCLASIMVRLFDNGNYVITYDVKTHNATLTHHH